MGVERLTAYSVRKGVLALNVKVHSYALSDAMKARLAALPTQTAYDLTVQAEAYACQEWWDWAQEAIESTTQIYSEGRSGGWLVLDKMSLSKIEENIYDAHECYNCAMRFEEHVENKCLFEPTVFEPMFHHAEILILQLEEYAEKIKQSLESVGCMVEDWLERFLDVPDEQAVSGRFSVLDGEPGDHCFDDPDGDAGLTHGG